MLNRVVYSGAPCPFLKKRVPIYFITAMLSLTSFLSTFFLGVNLHRACYRPLLPLKRFQNLLLCLPFSNSGILNAGSRMKQGTGKKTCGILRYIYLFFSPSPWVHLNFSMVSGIGLLSFLSLCKRGVSWKKYRGVSLWPSYNPSLETNYVIIVFLCLLHRKPGSWIRLSRKRCVKNV